MPRLTQLRWVMLCLVSFCGVASAAISVSSCSANTGIASDSAACLLQQRSTHEGQSQRILLEDARSERLAKSAPARQPKTSPVYRGKGDDFGNTAPRTIPKQSPRSGAKSEADRPGPSKEEEVAPTAGPGMVLSTALEDIVHDKVMSQRAELHITEDLSSVIDNYGSVDEFAKDVRAALLVDMGIDPRRLVILNVLGQYISQSDPEDHKKDVGHVARVDFEVYPGPPGVPTPADVIEKLAVKIRDMQGETMQGLATKKMMKDAALIIVHGLKATTPKADYEHAHSIVDNSSSHTEKEGHGGSHGSHNGGHNGGHDGDHHGGKSENDGYGQPWHSRWWKSLFGSHNAGVRSAPLTVVPLLLVLYIAA